MQNLDFKLRLAAPLVALILVLSLPLAAQDSPGRTPSGQSPSGQSPAGQSQDQPTETLKVNVEVVQLFFNVKDKHGALIPSLTKDDFEISEDGKPQTIKYFEAESDLPLTLGILIDSSGSQQRVLEMEKQVGGSFLEDTLRPKDEAFVISFDVDVDLLQDFTSSTRHLKHALNQAKINTGGIGCAGSGPIGPQGPLPCPSTGQRGTVLYDAVYLASHDELSQEVGRKAMILLTDGEDEGSRLKIKDAIEAAQKADAICYVLLIADRGFRLRGLWRRLRHEEAHPRDRRPHDRSGQQDRETQAGLRPDLAGTAQPVQHRLHSHQHGARRQLPQGADPQQAGRLQNPGARRILRHAAARGITFPRRRCQNGPRSEEMATMFHVEHVVPATLCVS